MVPTAPPIASNAACVRSTVATPSRVRSVPAFTACTACTVSAWISPTSAEICPAADGDDREAAPVLSRTGRLDRRVQRQQVRLIGDVGDRGDDVADRGRALGQVR